MLEMTKYTTLVITRQVNAAKSFDVIIFARETGLVNRKSAVFARTSFETMEVPKFIDCIAPQSVVYKNI